MNNVLKELIEEREKLNKEYKIFQKKFGDLREKINFCVVEQLISLGIYKTKYTLVKEQFIYSEHPSKLIMEYNEISKSIQKFLKEVSIEYVTLEKYVTMKCYGTAQPAIYFDLRIKPKEFIKKHQLEVEDLEIKHELERLQRLQEDYLK